MGIRTQFTHDCIDGNSLFIWISHLGIFHVVGSTLLSFFLLCAAVKYFTIADLADRIVNHNVR